MAPYVAVLYHIPVIYQDKEPAAAAALAGAVAHELSPSPHAHAHSHETSQKVKVPRLASLGSSEQYSRAELRTACSIIHIYNNTGYLYYIIIYCNIIYRGDRDTSANTNTVPGSYFTER